MLDLTGSYFTNVSIDEANNFDGWTGEVDLTIPFNDQLQMRAYLPFYTSGKADYDKPGSPEDGERIDVSDNGGVYDFPRVELDYQFATEASSGSNRAVYVAWGGVLDTLDISAASGDRFNHRGKVLIGGLRIDGTRTGSSVRLMGDLGVRHYYDTDDLNPDGNDSFTWADFRGAAVFDGWSAYFKPAVELTYLGNFGSVNMTTIIPELLMPVNDNFQIKAGVPIGLGGDGNQPGFTGRLSVLF